MAARPGSWSRRDAAVCGGWAQSGPVVVRRKWLRLLLFMLGSLMVVMHSNVTSKVY